MIRTILVLLFLLCFFIISIPLYLIEAIIGHFDIHKKERSSFVIVTTALKIIIWLSGIHLIVKGQKKVPKDQAVLYVSNHRSYFDIVTLYPLTNNTTGFVAKKERERIPFIRRWMRYMNCQFLDRENIKEGLKTILNCIATVKGGCSVCIFPEGTRTPGDDMLEFKEGSFKIAEKSGCLIIPVAITNTENAEGGTPTYRQSGSGHHRRYAERKQPCQCRILTITYFFLKKLFLFWRKNATLKFD